MAKHAKEVVAQMDSYAQYKHWREQYISWARGQCRLAGHEVSEEQLEATMDKLEAEGKIKLPGAKSEQSLHLYENDMDTVVASSVEDAVKVWCEVYGMSSEDSGEFFELPDTSPMTLFSKGWEGGQKTQTCAEWAQSIGRGYLSCRESDDDEGEPDSSG